MIGTILFVTFLVLLVIGAPIALCLGAAALLVVFTTGDVSPIVLGQRMFGSLDSFTHHYGHSIIYAGRQSDVFRRYLQKTDRFL